MAEANEPPGSSEQQFSPNDPPTYLPTDAMSVAIRQGALLGTAGFVYSTVSNRLSRQNYGASGVFTKFGGRTALFIGFGGIHGFVKTASANLREKNDTYNEALGGLFAGALLGLAKRRVQSVVGWAVLSAIGLAAYDIAGEFTLKDVPDTDENRFEEKRQLRLRFRRPLNETLNELGEGRGIYGPNYEERRRRRIKEAYGIDVPEPYYKTKNTE